MVNQLVYPSKSFFFHYFVRTLSFSLLANAFDIVLVGNPFQSLFNTHEAYSKMSMVVNNVNVPQEWHL
jgi:hypothetical protein